MTIVFGEIDFREASQPIRRRLFTVLPLSCVCVCWSGIAWGWSCWRCDDAGAQTSPEEHNVLKVGSLPWLWCKKEKRKIINIIKRHSEEKDKVAEVIKYVNYSGGIEYAEKAMYKYRDEAFELLKDLPESDVKDSIKAIVNYVTERKK